MKMIFISDPGLRPLKSRIRTPLVALIFVRVFLGSSSPKRGRVSIKYLDRIYKTSNLCSNRAVACRRWLFMIVTILNCEFEASCHGIPELGLDM
jgi:hypothetical protein